MSRLPSSNAAFFSAGSFRSFDRSSASAHFSEIAREALVSARIVMGDADSAGEQVQELMAIGLDGITANLPANGHDVEAVARTVGVLRAAVG